MVVLPVRLDEAELPPSLLGAVAIASNADVEKIVYAIDNRTATWLGLRAADEVKAAEVVARIESNSAEYVDEAIEEQRKQASTNRKWGHLWYGIGFLSLAAGLLAIGFGLDFFGDVPRETTGVTAGIYALRTAVIVGLVAACSKYSFLLGRSYTSESLKNSDRIHAISFGRFYVRAYGNHATWQELKEVFQNWNIDRASSFATIEAPAVDSGLPAIISGLIKRGDTNVNCAETSAKALQ